MQRKDVESSSILSIGYDENSSTLEVEFHGHRVYQYFNVPAAVYEDLMSADSHGAYLDKHVKKARYEYKEIR